MKAWLIEDPQDWEGRQAIIFADTRNEAKALAGCYDFDCSYIEVRATRYKSCDDMENLSTKELYRILWRSGWWFELGDDRIEAYDEDGVTEETFDIWWNRTYGKEEVVK